MENLVKFARSRQPASPAPFRSRFSSTIGITLWDGNTLLFSSEWTGAQTLEQLLDGGNLVAH